MDATEAPVDVPVVASETVGGPVKPEDVIVAIDNGASPAEHVLKEDILTPSLLVSVVPAVDLELVPVGASVDAEPRDDSTPDKESHVPDLGHDVAPSEHENVENSVISPPVTDNTHTSSDLHPATRSSSQPSSSSSTSTLAPVTMSPSAPVNVNTPSMVATSAPATPAVSLPAHENISSPTVSFRKDKPRRDKSRRGSRRSIRITHKKNLLGEIIFKGHPSWVLMLNIQTGIRNSVGKQVMPGSQETNGNGISPRPVTMKLLGPEDFERKSDFYKSSGVIPFPSSGSSFTIPHTTGPFKFKDYCPLAFRYLRHKFGIDPADFMVSVCNTLKNGDNSLRVLPTPGKSGSLFFFSHDMQYILKTIPKDEAKLLRAILPAYVQHVASNENTLLPKFFGMYRVKPHAGRQVRFVVMNNIFPTLRKIHERFDLKGSTAGRAASVLERQSATPTFKDLDFIKDKSFLGIGPERKVAFCDQIRKDAALLEKLNIMDYSLLVGVHYEDRNDVDSPFPFGKNVNMDEFDLDGEASPPPSRATSPTREINHSLPALTTLSGDDSTMSSSLRSTSIDASDISTSVSSTFVPTSTTNTPIQSTSSKLAPLSPSMTVTSIFNQDDGGMIGLDETDRPTGERYYVGIIDILMLYSTRKKIEHAYKAMRFGAHAISSVSPEEYSKRFADFATSVIR